jgi:integrase
MKKKKGTNIYEKKITLGRDDLGTPIRKSITGRTIPELNQRIEDAKQMWMRMHDVNESVLFSTYAEKWLANTKAVRSINTKRMYRETLDRHIIPEIGNLYFAEISLSDLQGIINDRADKYETCNKIRLTIRQIYNAAVDEGLAKGVNVKKLVLPPKPQSEKRALTDKETECIFAAPFTEQQKVFVKLLYYTGIRREEALALEPGDFTESSVRINKTIVFDDNAPILKPSAKSAAGNRIVPIPNEFKEELAEYLSKAGKILFPQPRNGGYMSKSSYNKFWKGITGAMAEIEPSAASLSAHIFRHNYATILYYSDISIKKAAQLMGHESTQMIMEIYAHLDEMQERTTEKLNEMFKMKTPRT